MSRRSRTLLLGGVPLMILVCIASVVLITRASIETKSATAKASRPPKVKDGPRNLALQPEAQRVARRLGKRFSPSARGTAVLTGTIKVNRND